MSKVKRPGVSETHHGYLRIMERKNGERGKMEHRAVVERLKKEQRRHAVAMLIRTDPEMTGELLQWLEEKEQAAAKERLPIELDVHHLDWDKHNNMPVNLLVLPEEIHEKCTPDGQPRDSRLQRWKRRGNR